MSLIKFVSASEAQINAEAITNGCLYYVPAKTNNGAGTLAYDLDNNRGWIRGIPVITLQEAASYTPAINEIVIISNGSGYSETDPDTNITTTYDVPLLVVGDGTTRANSLSMLGSSWTNANGSLKNIFQELENHINDSQAHFVGSEKADWRNEINSLKQVADYKNETLILPLQGIWDSAS